MKKLGGGGGGDGDDDSGGEGGLGQAHDLLPQAGLSRQGRHDTGERREKER